MNKTDKKVFQKLKALSKVELKKFDLFITSPYFNKSKEVIFVYQNIKKNINTAIEFEKNIIADFKQVNKNVSNSSIKKYTTAIINLIDLFLITEQTIANKVEATLKLSKYYFLNKRFDEFNKIIKTLRSTINTKKASAEHYFHLHKIEELQWYFESNNNDIRKNDCNISNKNDALDRFYLAEKMFTISEMLNRSEFTRKKVDATYINNVIKIFEKNADFKNDVLLKTWYLAVQLQIAVDDEKLFFFNKLLQEIKQKEIQLIDENLKNLNAIIMNQAKFVFKETKEYYSFLFQFYHTQINNKSIYRKGKINYLLVKNIVTVGIKEMQYNWLLNFLEDHNDKIFPKKMQKDVYNFSLARVHFFNKNLKESLSLIGEYNFKDIYYILSVKRLKLLLHYEQKELLLLDSLIKAFRMNLSPQRSKGISEIKKKYENNFINFFNKLYNITNNPNVKPDKITALKNELTLNNFVSDKSWLLEKVNECLKD